MKTRTTLMAAAALSLAATACHDDDDVRMPAASPATLKSFAVNDINNRTTDSAVPLEINDLNLGGEDNEDPTQFDDLLAST